MITKFSKPLNCCGFFYTPWPENAVYQRKRRPDEVLKPRPNAVTVEQALQETIRKHGDTLQALSKV